MKINTVLFDFDGTLADTFPIIIYSFRRVFSEYEGKDFTADEIIGMFGPGENEIFRKHISKYSCVEPAIERYYYIYKNKHRELAKSSPGIYRMLQMLRARGISLGVVTGKGKRSAEISLRELEMLPYFDVVITADDVVNPKPDPQGILIAVKRMNTSVERTVFVGDSNVDIKAGKQAGVITAGVKWFRPAGFSFDVEPDMSFDSIEDFMEYIKGTVF
ncbi:MAG: Phosphoglycolate phosphatase [Firmicutes bacterium]|nr:Phosphoglycolate phosphatase [Bacillota bacterium]